MLIEFSVFAAETSFGAHINGQEVKDMIKTFKEVSETKTVDFCSLAAGDYFHYGHTYYMKLIIGYTMDKDCYYNAVDIKNGVLVFFCSHTRVKPYKECEVILHE